MPEYLSPGIYVQEVNTGPRPIEGVGTACAAFVGFAAAGPANRPVLVTSWTQYVQTFGSLDDSGVRNPHIEGAYLSHAVYGYFLNGGGRCYVTRIVNVQASAEKPTPLQLPSRASKAVPSFFVHPKTRSSRISRSISCRRRELGVPKARPATMKTAQSNPVNKTCSR